MLGSKLSRRRFGLWFFGGASLRTFLGFPVLEPRRNRSGVVELVGKQRIARIAAVACE